MTPSRRPAVRVNQLGYLPSGPKHATLVSSAAGPVDFAVVDEHGRNAYAGRSRPWPERPEPTSGLDLHTLDFSRLDCGRPLHGRGGRRPQPPVRDRRRSVRRSGRRCPSLLLPPAVRRVRSTRPGLRATADPPATSGCRRTPATPPSRPGPARTPSGCIPAGPRRGRFDVSGGWYDAGDHGKYVTSGALPAWQLLATVDLLRAHPDTAPTGLEVGAARGVPLAAGLAAADAGAAGPPVRGPGLPPRPRHRVGTAGDVAAPGSDDPGAAPALHRGRAAPGRGRRAGRADRSPRSTRGTPIGCSRPPAARYRAAQDQPRLIAPDDQGAFGGGPYGDDDLSDDFFWAAAELWLATGAEPTFGLRVPAAPADVPDLDGFDFDRVAAPARLDLAQPGHSTGSHRAAGAAGRLLALQQEQPWGQPYAPDRSWGWGSNGRLAQQPDGAGLRVRAGRDPRTSSPPSEPASTTCSAATPWVRATSPGTAPTSAGTSAPGTSRTIMIRPSRRRRPAAWPAVRPTRPIRTSPTTRGCPICRRSVPTSTCPPPRPPTTSASAGTPRWSGWPPS